MKRWLKEQAESMLILLGIMTLAGALEWITFAVLGID